MKHHLPCVISLFLFFISTVSLSAQKIGVEIGLNHSIMANNMRFPYTEFQAKSDLQTGSWADLAFDNRWGIRPGLRYTRKGARIHPFFFDLDPTHIHYEYLGIPVQLYIRQGAVQFRLGGSIDLPFKHYLYDEETKARLDPNVGWDDEFWETGINVSLEGGMAYQYKRFQLSIHYQYSLTPTLTDLFLSDAIDQYMLTEDGAHHRNWIISVGYTLWEKK